MTDITQVLKAYALSELRKARLEVTKQNAEPFVDEALEAIADYCGANLVVLEATCNVCGAKDKPLQESFDGGRTCLECLK